MEFKLVTKGDNEHEYHFTLKYNNIDIATEAIYIILLWAKDNDLKNVLREVSWNTSNHVIVCLPTTELATEFMLRFG